MAITINGSGTITGISAGGLPDGSITGDDIASLAASKLTGLKTVNGSSIVGSGDISAGGGLLQSNRAQLNGRPTLNLSTNSWANAGLSVTITPSSTSSKILVVCRACLWATNSAADSNLRILRSTDGSNYSSINPNTNPQDGTVDPASISANMRGEQTLYGQTNTWFSLDAPSTTNECTYKLQIACEGEITLNRGNQGAAARFGQPPAEIVVLEIGV